jgi:hypothetical protein
LQDIKKQLINNKPKDRGKRNLTSILYIQIIRIVLLWHKNDMLVLSQNAFATEMPLIGDKG